MSDRRLSPATDDRLVLPADLAAATVEAFFEDYGVTGATVKYTAAEAAEYGVDLPAGCWLIVLPLQAKAVAQRVLPKAEYARLRQVWRSLTLIQPAGVLTVKGQSRPRLLRALEEARPVQPNGLPFPWVPPAAPTQPLGRLPDDDDVVLDASAPPALDPDAVEPDAASDAPLSATTIREDFERIRAHLGLPALPLVIRRGAEAKQGFVTGRVHVRPDGRATRMVITTCPNADRAEAAATLLHEFAHIVCDASGHGPQFKATMVELAGAIFGAAHFAGARDALPQPSSIVDGWIATGVRAALAGRPGPTAVHPEEAQAAVVVRRVQKLRALARDQRGTPEGCLAAARANDLIVTYGLGGYQVELPGDLGEQLCDQWIHVGERQPWKASVAFTVARFSDVFALHSPSYAGMHLFGRYADVVTAAWLYTVATERIQARCAEHMRQWRAAGRKGATSERAAFRNSAAFGLREALVKARADAQADASVVHMAEDFAQVEHEKRGMRWGGGKRRRFRLNAAGRAAGGAIALSKGIEGRAAKGLLE